MAKTHKPSARSLANELHHCREIVARLKRQKMISDPLLAGVRSDAIERYLDALSHVVVERMAPGRGEPKPMGRKGYGGHSPNLVPGWASDLIEQELRELNRRAERLEKWANEPRPVKSKKRRSKQCQECGRGLQRGAVFCPFCGEKVQEDR